MEEKKYEFSVPTQHKSIIKVIGVGGGGSNAVSYMYGRGIKDVEFIACNTDVQALNLSPVPAKLQIGSNLTEGLGAGANPEVGREAAMESREEIREILSHNTKMLFITAGMGGGTGTGAAPVIAEIAKELGILTVAIVTAPFNFEGKKKKKYADIGIASLRENCDTLLVISNEKLREIYGTLKMSEAFSQADNILTTAAKGIAEMITIPQDINVDFEDVKTVMRNSGAAVMGSAKADGTDRALRAAQEALTSPLLNNQDIFGAQKILLSIMSGEKAELQMDELTTITDYIQERVGDEAEMIFGTGLDATLGESIRVTIIATGFIEKVEEEIKPKFEFKPKSTNNNNAQEEENRNYTFNLSPKSQMNQIFEEKKEKIIFNLEDDINADDEKKNDIEAQLKAEAEAKKERFNQLAEERIKKLKNLSKSLETTEGLKEKIEVPAYLRRNVKLIETPHNNGNVEKTTPKSNFNDENQILGNNKFFDESDE